MITVDTQLQRDIMEELEWDPSLDASKIGVAAKSGIITLTGEVKTFAEKLAAERAAKRVYGVAGVANDIEVKIPSVSQRTDTDVAGAAVNTLKWNASLPPDRIQVTVRHGYVTLTGTVDWRYQKDSAERCVRELTGVKGVHNEIAIKPVVKVADVKQKIESAFKRSAEMDARRLLVEASNGKVCLKGHVKSWAERDEAEEAAWAAPGVVEVDNQLEITG
jgi:osmotically-inducible protein OsmY